MLPHAREFSRHLLALHRAENLGQFWERLIALIEETIPVHSVSLYFDYFAIKSGFRVLHHQVDGGTPRPWEERRKVSPTPRYLRTHVGRKSFGSEELPPPPAYFRRVMQAEGWRSLFCVVFWEKKNPRTILVLRKSNGQGTFTREETMFLEDLHGHLETVFERLRRHQYRDIATRCLSQSLRHGQLGVLVLDENLLPIFHGGETPPTDRVPSAILDACQSLRKMTRERPLLVESIADKSWQAEVSLIPPQEPGLVRPCFLVQWIRVLGSSAPRRPPSLGALTPREREVAMAATRGLSNKEIAHLHGKTEATVKAQLLSIFQKLRIKRRAQLAVLMLQDQPRRAKKLQSKTSHLPKASLESSMTR